MGHDGLTRSPSGLSERRTGFSPPELGSPTAPVVPPTGAVPCPHLAGPPRSCAAGACPSRRPRGAVDGGVVHRAVVRGGVIHRSRRGVVARVRAGGTARRHDLPPSPRRRRRCLRRPRRQHARARGRPPARGHRAAGRRRRPRPRSRRSRGDRRRRAPARPAVGRPARTSAAGCRPTSWCRCSPARSGCHVLSARGGAPPEVPERAVLDVARRPRRGPGPRRPRPARRRARCCRPRARPGGARARRASGCAPGPSPTPTPVAGSRTGRAGRVDSGRGLSRPRSAASAQVGGDLRLVTRGARAGPDVVDDVVAHLGVAHLHHLPDDPHVPRAAERGLFPGIVRDAVRRCADVVVAAVDDAAVAS